MSGLPNKCSPLKAFLCSQKLKGFKYINTDKHWKLLLNIKLNNFLSLASPFPSHPVGQSDIILLDYKKIYNLKLRVERERKEEVGRKREEAGKSAVGEIISNKQTQHPLNKQKFGKM